MTLPRIVFLAASISVAVVFGLVAIDGGQTHGAGYQGEEGDNGATRSAHFNIVAP